MPSGPAEGRGQGPHRQVGTATGNSIERPPCPPHLHRMSLLAGIGFAAAALCFYRAWRLDFDQGWLIAGILFFICARLAFEAALRGV